MFSFTAQHILVMRLITQYGINSSALLHNFLFLVSAESLEKQEIGFYDYIRTKNGAFSPALQLILEELIISDLLSKEQFTLTTKGMDSYCALATALRPFDEYLNRCFSIYMRFKDNMGLIHTAIKSHITFYKVRKGKRIFSS